MTLQTNESRLAEMFNYFDVLRSTNRQCGAAAAAAVAVVDVHFAPLYTYLCV